MDNEIEWYYNREKLYEEVWSEPVMKVAERYGVSGVAIAKTCKKMHIPVPGRRYWNKVQSGQKLEKTPLPVCFLQRKNTQSCRENSPPLKWGKIFSRLAA